VEIYPIHNRKSILFTKIYVPAKKHPKNIKNQEKTALASEFIDYYLRIRQQLIVPI